MKLLNSHLTAFLHFCLVFSVLGILKFVGSACTTALKLYLQTENPLAVKLIVAGYHKARYAYGVTVLLGVSFRMTVETVGTIVLECRDRLTVTAHAVFAEALILGYRVSILLC